jgi:hypothetical protein
VDLFYLGAKTPVADSDCFVAHDACRDRISLMRGDGNLRSGCGGGSAVMLISILVCLSLFLGSTCENVRIDGVGCWADEDVVDLIVMVWEDVV